MIMFRLQKTGSTFSRALKILSSSDRRKLVAITAIQVFLGIMDLFGVLAIGLLGTLSISGIQASEPSNKVSSILKIFGLSNSNFQTQISIIGITAVVLLISRTFLSIFLFNQAPHQLKVELHIILFLHSDIKYKS